MFKMIIRWLKERKINKANEKYVEGYNWAAGALLRGEETIESIDSKIELSKENESIEMFDYGAKNACMRYEEIKGE